MSHRSTAECDCPQRLRPGDVVEASFKQRYYPWIVRETTDIDDLVQSVVASHPGRGAVRFKWFGTHFRRGEGSGMKFYFVKLQLVDPGTVWQHTNGNVYRVMFITNSFHPHEQHPPHVVYETLQYPERKWSRPLSDWHRSFTFVRSSP